MSDNQDLTPTGRQRRDWPALRREFEGGAVGYRRFAKLRGIPVTTLNQRIMREGWTRNAILVRRTAREIDARLQTKVKQQIEADLAPWIEAEKAKFTKAGIKVAKIGMKRVHKMFKQDRSPDPKSEAFISKSAETYHRIGRVALGMSDGTAPAMPLSLNVLANHSAIQIVQPGKSQE